MTAPPGKLADRPAPATGVGRSPQGFVEALAVEDGALGLEEDSQPHDLLSELLRSVRLSGDRIVAFAPPRSFSMDFAGMGSLLVIEEGEVALRIDGESHVEHVGRGDFVLLPRGDRHCVSDVGGRGRAIVPGDAADDDAPEPARWLRGTFTIGDPQASHLLGSLPAVI